MKKKYPPAAFQENGFREGSYLRGYRVVNTDRSGSGAREDYKTRLDRRLAAEWLRDNARRKRHMHFIECDARYYAKMKYRLFLRECAAALRSRTS